MDDAVLDEVLGRSAQDTRAADAGGEVVGLQHQQLLPSGVPGAGALQIRIAVRPGLAPEYDRKVACR